MDACLMANFETAYTLKDCADYILASEEIEPTGGWNYEALFDAIADNKSISAEKLGKAVCDGFQKKYSDPGSDYATLSLIDLSKIDALQTAFNDTMASLASETIEIKEIRNIADSAQHSCRCGANSDYTGYSNLIDMSDFAKYYCGLLKKNDLSKAVSSCISYCVSNDEGSEHDGHDGLSFYYPLNYNAESFKTYYENICPSASYKSYLKQVYQNMPESTIELKDVSATDDGEVKVNVTDESLPYILDKEYILYEILEYSGDGEDQFKDIQRFKMLSVDNDVTVEGEGKTYISNFRGVTVTLNGVELFYNFVGKDHDSYFFEAPVTVNGEAAYLRFAFVFDDTKFNNGEYEIIGYWNGIDSTNGMLDKGFKPLKPDDDVEVDSIEIGSAVSEDEDDDVSIKKVPKSEDGYKISEEPLTGKYYLYKLWLVDIYGRVGGRQVNAIFRMTKTPEELKKNPLPDGTSAGEVVKVWTEDL